MDSTLRIAVFNEKGIVPVTIVHLTGILDWKTHQDFEDRTFEAIAAGAVNILIDMGGVGFHGQRRNPRPARDCPSYPHRRPKRRPWQDGAAQSVGGRHARSQDSRS
jgi:hypothetical protein